MSRTILIPFVILFLFKVLLAAVFPVFGDEAYYSFWGNHPAGGYYDLPPMIGWWLAPLVRISSNPLWLRIWNLLVPVLISFGLYEWLRKERGPESSALLALLFFALPLPFLTVISFPDVPLLFFGFFSALLFHSSVLAQTRFFSAGVVLSGALFGSAFLSKYFAVFLLPAFAVWAWPRAKNRVGVILSFAAGAFPFLVQHLLWNERNCQANLVFNLITRQKAFEGTFLETTGFLGLHLLAVSATVIPFLRFERGKSALNGRGGLRTFFALLWMVPVSVFFATALLGRGQGLHWLLYLTPFFVAWAGFFLPPLKARKSVLVSAFFSGLLGTVLCLSFLMPERVMPRAVRNRYPFEFGIITGARDFITQLKGEISGSDRVFFESYALASLVYHEFRRHPGMSAVPGFSVVSSGSRFGRVFDFETDWKSLQGKTISILKTGAAEIAKYSPYFESVKEQRSFFRGAEYSVLTGTGFDSRKFWQERVLPELEQFYPQAYARTCKLKEVYRAD